MNEWQQLWTDAGFDLISLDQYFDNYSSDIYDDYYSDDYYSRNSFNCCSFRDNYDNYNPDDFLYDFTDDWEEYYDSIYN